jgi:hypothetical protein
MTWKDAVSWSHVYSLYCDNVKCDQMCTLQLNSAEDWKNKMKFTPYVGEAVNGVSSYFHLDTLLIINSFNFQLISDILQQIHKT